VRDAIITRVWAPEGKRPICMVTGSHDRTVVFGAMDMQGRQIFRQYGSFDGESFLDFLRQVHRRYGRLYLFLDRARQHYRTKKVLEYIRRNRATLRVRWIPVGSPAFNVMEECWRQMDNDVLVLTFFSSLGGAEAGDRRVPEDEEVQAGHDEVRPNEQIRLRELCQVG
jgi:hypothetical protein